MTPRNLTPFRAVFGDFFWWVIRCIYSGSKGVLEDSQEPDRGRRKIIAGPCRGSANSYSTLAGWGSSTVRGSTTFQKRQPFTELPVIAFAAALSER